MSVLVDIICSENPEILNRSLDAFARGADDATLLHESQQLDQFRRNQPNLYWRVRAHFFLYAIHRFHLPLKSRVRMDGLIPFSATVSILKRRFEEAIEILLQAQKGHGP